MGLSNHKEEQLRKQPIVEAKYFRSEDGKFIVHKTITTDIKPIAYMEKVLTNGQAEEEEA
jgi:hypothetical protein